MLAQIWYAGYEKRIYKIANNSYKPVIIILIFTKKIKAMKANHFLPVVKISK